MVEDNLFTILPKTLFTVLWILALTIALLTLGDQLFLYPRLFTRSENDFHRFATNKPLAAMRMFQHCPQD